jgi:hypothetical protein
MSHIEWAETSGKAPNLKLDAGLHSVLTDGFCGLPYYIQAKARRVPYSTTSVSHMLPYLPFINNQSAEVAHRKLLGASLKTTDPQIISSIKRVHLVVTFCACAICCHTSCSGWCLWLFSSKKAEKLSSKLVPSNPSSMILPFGAILFSYWKDRTVRV